MPHLDTKYTLITHRYSSVIELPRRVSHKAVSPVNVSVHGLESYLKLKIFNRVKFIEGNLYGECEVLPLPDSMIEHPHEVKVL